MKTENIKTHLLLSHDFGASNTVAVENNHMPAPLAPLYVIGDLPTQCATCVLPEGALRYYPLVLEDFMTSDVIRAHFECHTKNALAYTRYDYEQLRNELRLLKPFAEEAVAGWNLVQLRTAAILMEHAPAHGRAVSLSAIGSFRKSPHSFYNALTSHPAGGPQ